MVLLCVLQLIKFSEGHDNCHIFDKINLIVNSSISQDGFHRSLLTSVKIDGQPFINQIVLSFKIPSGLYVDPEELNYFQNDYETFQYVVDKKINVELPEYKSEPFNLHLKIPVTNEQAFASVPIHVRYHKSQNCSKETDHVEVAVDKPAVYVVAPKSTCEALFDTVSMWGSLWVKVPYKLTSEPHTLKINIPVGCLEDTGLVLSLTTIVTIFGCCWLGFVLFKNKGHV